MNTIINSEDEIYSLFEKYDDFDNRHLLDSVEVSGNRDLELFTMISKFSNQIIAGAEHDIIYFYLSDEDLVGKVTENDIMRFVKLGMHLDIDCGCFCTFV